jgi:Cof subfamily protein (haloacid dehalogenase superfamily)
MPPKLLAVDLDGTLLTSSRQLDPRNVAALRRAREAGIDVVLASGRLITSMKPFAEQLGLSGPFICCNGAHMLDDGIELLHDGLDRRVLATVIDYCMAHRLHLTVYARTEVFFLFESVWGDLYTRRTINVVPRLLEEIDATTLDPSKLLLIGEPSDMPGHAAALKTELAELPCRITASEPEFLDLMSPGTSKGTALRTLAVLRGVERTNIAAIGDYLNDLEMIQFAGVSAAIGNALPIVKAAANSVVSSNDQAGVAEFVDSLLRNGRE